MAFNYEWLDSMGGDCKVKVSIKDKVITVDIISLLNEFSNLQNIVNEWDINKYSKQELEDFESKFNLLEEFVEMEE